MNFGRFDLPSRKPKHATHHVQYNRLRRIEGQVRGLQKMIMEEQYCIKILEQFKSVHGALKIVELDIFQKHVESCVLSALKQRSSKDIKILYYKLTNIIHLQ